MLTHFAQGILDEGHPSISLATTQEVQQLTDLANSLSSKAVEVKKTMTKLIGDLKQAA